MCTCALIVEVMAAGRLPDKRLYFIKEWRDWLVFFEQSFLVHVSLEWHLANGPAFTFKPMLRSSLKLNFHLIIQAPWLHLFHSLCHCIVNKFILWFLIKFAYCKYLHSSIDSFFYYFFFVHLFSFAFSIFNHIVLNFVSWFLSPMIYIYILF